MCSLAFCFISPLFSEAVSKSTTGFRASAFVATAVRMDLEEFHGELQT